MVVIGSANVKPVMLFYLIATYLLSTSYKFQVKINNVNIRCRSICSKISGDNVNAVKSDLSVLAVSVYSFVSHAYNDPFLIYFYI